jgi:hypothetical protein
MTAWKLPRLPQHGLHRLALVGGQRFLGQNGIADLIALNRQRRLDAGSSTGRVTGLRKTNNQT